MIRFRSRRVRALLAFFAFTTPLGIAAHLVSEFFGLGWHDDADVLFSPRHGYLAALAVASLAALVVSLRALPRGDRRRRVEALIRELPCRGQGFGFTCAAFVAQFAIFAITQLGEGCPLCGGDVVTGVLAAAVAASIGAVAIAFGKRRVVELALALVQFFVAASCAAAPAKRELCQAGFRAAATRRRRPFSFRYRPPPAQAGC